MAEQGGGGGLPISKGGGWGLVSDIIGAFSSGGDGGIAHRPQTAQIRQRRFAPSSQPAPPAPSTPGGQVSLPSVLGGFDPLGAITGGLKTARQVMEQLYPTLYMIQMLRQLFGGGSAATPSTGIVYVPPTTSAPTSYPATAPASTIYTAPKPGATGGITVPYSFMPDVSGGGSFLGDLGNLAYGIGGLVQAFSAPSTPATTPWYNPLGFNIPGVDIVSPIQTEATTAAQTGCAAAMSPWKTVNASAVRPKMHIQVNPATGALTFFAPVKITGVKPYNTGIRRRRRCCSGKR